jgi:hypothetical protein
MANSNTSTSTVFIIVISLYNSDKYIQNTKPVAPTVTSKSFTGWNAMQFAEFQTFQRSISPPFSTQKTVLFKQNGVDEVSQNISPIRIFRRR